MQSSVSLPRAMLVFSGCLVVGIMIGLLMPFTSSEGNLRSSSKQQQAQQQQQEEQPAHRADMGLFSRAARPLQSNDQADAALLRDEDFAVPKLEALDMFLSYNFD